MHNKGLVPTHSVPLTYVKYLGDIVGTCGVPCLSTAVVLHTYGTYVKTECVPPCAATWRVALHSEWKTWLSHLLLEHLYILIISSAEHFYLCTFLNLHWTLLQFYFYFISIFTSFAKSLKIRTIWTEEQKSREIICIYYLIIVYSPGAFLAHISSDTAQKYLKNQISTYAKNVLDHLFFPRLANMSTVMYSMYS